MTSPGSSIPTTTTMVQRSRPVPASIPESAALSSNTAPPLPSASSASGDDWRVVEDKKLRKKIQDRLAQRARRRRIAESKQRQNETQPATQVEMELVSAVVPAASLSTAEYHLLPRRFMSALTALFNNGIALGMHPSQSCSLGVSRDTAGVPESLQPTELQLSTLHYTSIDRFPFPTYRDNLILMQEVIDPQEFMYDIINMHSFWVVDGKPSWDQSAWRMGKDYEKKWGYLFFGDGRPPVSSMEQSMGIGAVAMGMYPTMPASVA